MKDTVIYRQTRAVLLAALLSSYFIRRFKVNGHLIGDTITDQRQHLFAHVDKANYGTLVIVERTTTSINKVEIKNPACIGVQKNVELYVHFDFTKEDPSLSYTYRDTDIKFHLPDSFELEEELP